MHVSVQTAHYHMPRPRGEARSPRGPARRLPESERSFQRASLKGEKMADRGDPSDPAHDNSNEKDTGTAPLAQAGARGARRKRSRSVPPRHRRKRSPAAEQDESLKPSRARRVWRGIGAVSASVAFLYAVAVGVASNLISWRTIEALGGATNKPEIKPPPSQPPPTVIVTLAPSPTETPESSPQPSPSLTTASPTPSRTICREHSKYEVIRNGEVRDEEYNDIGDAPPGSVFVRYAKTPPSEDHEDRWYGIVNPGTSDSVTGWVLAVKLSPDGTVCLG